MSKSFRRSARKKLKLDHALEGQSVQGSLFETLPNEIISEMMEFIPYEDLCTLGAVSKRMNFLSAHELSKYSSSFAPSIFYSNPNTFHIFVSSCKRLTAHWSIADRSDYAIQICNSWDDIPRMIFFRDLTAGWPSPQKVSFIQHYYEKTSNFDITSPSKSNMELTYPLIYHFLLCWDTTNLADFIKSMTIGWSMKSIASLFRILLTNTENDDKEDLFTLILHFTSHWEDHHLMNLYELIMSRWDIKQQASFLIGVLPPVQYDAKEFSLFIATLTSTWASRRKSKLIMRIMECTRSMFLESLTPPYEEDNSYAASCDFDQFRRILMMAEIGLQSYCSSS